jgi:hypothetical protein
MRKDSAASESDPEKIGLTAQQVGKAPLDGEPRFLTHAAGEGRALLIRPVAMKPGEHKIVRRAAGVT